MEKKLNKALQRWLVLVTLGLLCASVAHSQACPNLPVRLIVGFSPGGGTDVVARVVGQKVSEALGQQMIIENRPGATGTIAANVVAKATPVGYTLLVAHVNSNAIGPSVFAKFNKALNDKDMKAKLLPVGAELAGGSAAEFDAFIKTEIDKNAKLTRDANVKME